MNKQCKRIYERATRVVKQKQQGKDQMTLMMFDLICIVPSFDYVTHL